MSKIIQSPSKRYPGTITLAYPLTFPQYAAWRRALDKLPDAPPDDENPGWRIFDLANDPDKAFTMLPAVFEIVEKWDLANMPEPLTVENFPSSPAKSVFKVVIRLLSAINEIISEDDEAPFEPPAPLTDLPETVGEPQLT